MKEKEILMKLLNMIFVDPPFFQTMGGFAVIIVICYIGVLCFGGLVLYMTKRRRLKSNEKKTID